MTTRIPRLIPGDPFEVGECLPPDTCLLGTRLGELLPERVDGEHERWYPFVVAAFVISIIAPN